MTVTNEEIEDFLSHYGVPGMKWGVRNNTPAKKRAKTINKKRKAAVKAQRKSRSRGEKATIALVTAGSAFVGANLGTAFTMNPVSGAAIGGAAGVAGKSWAESKLDSAAGRKSISELMTSR